MYCRVLFCKFLDSIKKNPTYSRLAAAWIAGLFFGAFLNHQANGFSLNLFHRAFDTTPSVAGFFLVGLLPVIFSAICIRLFGSRFLTEVVFLKGLLFSYVAFGICALYGTASWLILLLFGFSDIFSLPILWMFWLRCKPCFDGYAFRRALIMALLPNSLLLILDYCFISPFGVSLI